MTTAAPQPQRASAPRQTKSSSRREASYYGSAMPNSLSERQAVARATEAGRARREAVLAYGGPPTRGARSLSPMAPDASREPPAHVPPRRGPTRLPPPEYLTEEKATASASSAYRTASSSRRHRSRHEHHGGHHRHSSRHSRRSGAESQPEARHSHVSTNNSAVLNPATEGVAVATPMEQRIDSRPAFTPSPLPRSVWPGAGRASIRAPSHEDLVEPRSQPSPPRPSMSSAGRRSIGAHTTATPLLEPPCLGHSSSTVEAPRRKVGAFPSSSSRAPLPTSWSAPVAHTPSPTPASVQPSRTAAGHEDHGGVQLLYGVEQTDMESIIIVMEGSVMLSASHRRSESPSLTIHHADPRCPSTDSMDGRNFIRLVVPVARLNQMTVGDCKREVERQRGIPVELLELVGNGVALHDDLPLGLLPRGTLLHANSLAAPRISADGLARRWRVLQSPSEKPRRREGSTAELSLPADHGKQAASTGKEDGGPSCQPHLRSGASDSGSECAASEESSSAQGGEGDASVVSSVARHMRHLRALLGEEGRDLFTTPMAPARRATSRGATPPSSSSDYEGDDAMSRKIGATPVLREPAEPQHNSSPHLHPSPKNEGLATVINIGARGRSISAGASDDSTHEPVCEAEKKPATTAVTTTWAADDLLLPPRRGERQAPPTLTPTPSAETALRDNMGLPHCAEEAGDFEGGVDAWELESSVATSFSQQFIPVESGPENGSAEISRPHPTTYEGITRLQRRAG